MRLTCAEITAVAVEQLSRMKHLVLFLVVVVGLAQAAVAAPEGTANDFPLPLHAYGDAEKSGVWDVLWHRAKTDPFNVVGTLIFLCAIVHTFFTSKLRHLSHVVEERHTKRLAERAAASTDRNNDGSRDEVSFGGQVLHFLGEVEAVFGLWVLVLAGAITYFRGWETVESYLTYSVTYTEPIFVVVVMTIASTRPVLWMAERCLARVAGLMGGSVSAWWLSILIVTPVMGSFITEPAAMTIAALLLAKRFYPRGPSAKLAYATLGLLFVNISVGGTLTHFAAPPVLMVAGPWNWDLAHMATNFGWKACLGILIATGVYRLTFRAELSALEQKPAPIDRIEAPVPYWIVGVHLLFLAFAVWQAHHPALFIGAFLFFLAFYEATAHHQSPLSLRPALLVGFFLAGLVIHGGVQQWWIQPVLSGLGNWTLFTGAVALTAFNDNAAITLLATLVPGFTDQLKYAVVAGAVVGGGLTVIANAPNPAGQSILSRFFKDSVSPLKLLLGALIPTLIMAACFMLF